MQAGSALLGRLPELEAMLEKDGGKLGKVVEYTSYPEAYQDLALGRVDYVVNTIINLKTLVAEKPHVFEIGQAVSGKSYPAWAVAKGNKELLAFLNDFIAKEKANGTLRRASEEVVRRGLPGPAGYVRAGVLAPRRWSVMSRGRHRGYRSRVPW